MGITYRIDRADRIVRSRGWGVLTLGELQDFYSRLQADPGFEWDFRRLGDLREVTEIVVTSGELAESASLPIFEPGTRRALVASRDVVYGMLRAYAAFNQRMGQTVRIFRDIETADAWLASGDDGLWKNA
jgi:hypothetical protein